MELRGAFTVLISAAVGVTTIAATEISPPDMTAVRQLFRSERLEAGSTNIRPLQPIDDAAWIWAGGETLWGERNSAAEFQIPEVPLRV